LKDGIDKDDFYITKLLKKFKDKKVILVVNKAESIKNTNENNYYALGFGKPYYISAEHSIGTGDLLDEIIKLSPRDTFDFNKNFSFCIIGRTNVGKSTLLNAIVKEERVIASPIEHTTRDSIDVEFNFNKEKYTIIDTAGIRRKGKIIDNVEKYAVLRTINSTERSNLIILLIDGSEPFNEQDETIGGIAFKANIPTIIVVNKCDKFKNDQEKIKELTNTIRFKFNYLSYAPIVFISALEKNKIEKIFKKIEEIRTEMKIQVNTSMLNKVLDNAMINNQPPKHKGGRLNISYGTQVKGQVPTFVIFVNDPKYVHFTYMRYIENQIKNSFGILNVPIVVYYKDKNSRIREE
jgi:GTP-binding protein